jgi:hypothetical protein
MNSFEWRTNNLDLIQAEALLKLDEEARVDKLNFTLDDLLCCDETPSMRKHSYTFLCCYWTFLLTFLHAGKNLIEACTSSMDILDSRIYKISMRRRIDLLEQYISTRAAATDLSEMNADIRALLANKVICGRLNRVKMLSDWSFFHAYLAYRT